MRVRWVAGAIPVAAVIVGAVVLGTRLRRPVGHPELRKSLQAHAPTSTRSGMEGPGLPSRWFLAKHGSSGGLLAPSRETFRFTLLSSARRPLAESGAVAIVGYNSILGTRRSRESVALTSRKACGLADAFDGSQVGGPVIGGGLLPGLPDRPASVATPVSVIHQRAPAWSIRLGYQGSVGLFSGRPAVEFVQGDLLVAKATGAPLQFTWAGGTHLARFGGARYSLRVIHAKAARAAKRLSHVKCA